MGGWDISDPDNISWEDTYVTNRISLDTSLLSQNLNIREGIK